MRGRVGDHRDEEAQTKRRVARRSTLTPYLFLLPGLALFAAFRLYPLVDGLRLSFTNARLGRAQYALVGLANYQRLLDDTRFHVSLVNTAFYAVASTLPILAVPLALAIAGPLNYYLRALGLPARSWLADPTTAMWAIILTSVWWVTGYYLVIYLAGLQDIPRDLYEAASLDGAGGWRSFWAITLPLLRPVFLFVFVTHIIGSFQIFGQVFILTQGGPGDATRTVVQHLYETAFQNFFQFGSASAMAWVLFAVILVFSLLQFRLLRGHTQY